MTAGQRVDIVVIGAGPAGSCAARSAAEAGARVLLLDKKERIGEPVQCAEYVPRLLTREIRIPDEAIAQEVTGMITFLPDRSETRKNAPGYILHRNRFDQALAVEAARSGAECLTGTRGVSWDGRVLRIQGPRGDESIRPKVIIGADGPNSSVGSWIGQRNRKLLVALQHTVSLKRSLTDTEVYFHKEYPGGYGWLFPKGAEANVGVGVQKHLGGSAKQSLAAFKKHLGDRIGEARGVTGGVIPAGGPLPAVDVTKRVLLAGDAAGHAHAVTGGGIPQAVIGGTLAGKAAADVIRGDMGAFDNYSREWKKAFGALLAKAADKRVTMENEWHKGDLSELVRRTWIAFPEYYNES